MRVKATINCVWNYAYFTNCSLHYGHFPLIDAKTPKFYFRSTRTKFRIEVKHVHTVETIWYKQNDSVFLWSVPRMFGAVKILVTYVCALLIHDVFPLCGMRQWKIIMRCERNFCALWTRLTYCICEHAHHTNKQICGYFGGDYQFGCIIDANSQ